MLFEDSFSRRLYILEGTFNPNQGWVTVTTKSQHETVDLNGRKYIVVDEKERYLALFSCQRITDVAKAVLLTIVTLFLAPVLSENIRDLYSGRQVLLIVKAVNDSLPHQQFTESMIDMGSKGWITQKEYLAKYPVKPQKKEIFNMDFWNLRLTVL